MVCAVVVFVGGGTVPMRAYEGPPGISLVEASREAVSRAEALCSR